MSKRILQVFDDIEKLKQQAEANEKTAEAAQKAAKKAEIEKINALQKKVKSDSISIILNAKNKILQVANDSVALLIEKAKQKISQQVEKQKRTTQLANNLLQAQIIAEDDPTLAYNILSQTIEEDSLNDAQNKNVKKIAQSAIMCNPNNMFAQKMYGQHYGVVAAFFSPDDSLLVSFANSEAKVWTNNSCINTILLPPNLRITNNIAISFSPNKKDALLLHENRIWLLHLTAQKGVVEALDIDGNGEISSI
ncbi:MAG TPA: hypothetical protein PK230_15435, partial [Chitinophagales bacterium]|nr:hypothetical protein [Chitinophagales bacterium]